MLNKETPFIPIEPKFHDKSPYIEPEHWHCPKCSKEDYMFVGMFKKVCKNCYANDAVYREMFQCTYTSCVSS